MNPNLQNALLLASLAVASVGLASAGAGCSSTIDVGGNDGGSNDSDGGASDDDGGSSTPLSDAAKSSPNFARCKVACAAPADGPCKTVDPNPCIEKCTAFTEGLAPGCAQCVVEHSQYTGTQCVPSPCGTRCPDVKCDYPTCAQDGCAGAAGQPAPACDPACTPADEKCDGIELGKTTNSDCTTACK